jgi:hypothetical protein
LKHIETGGLALVVIGKGGGLQGAKMIEYDWGR